jgi:translation elongation factor EF-1beta
MVADEFEVSVQDVEGDLTEFINQLKKIEAVQRVKKNIN